MAGKVCLVTGATAGIGQVTARELARRGQHVVIVGRSPERCATALAEIKAQSPAGSAESLVADLSSLADLRRLADQVRERFPRLDVLVNNAGGIFLSRRETADGIEMTLALNHLSYFVLTNLLLDLLKASKPARVVNVASDAHKGVSINFDDIQGKTRYRGWRAYQQSKLANILFTNELARRLEGSGVTANCLHPGFVRTTIFRERGAVGWLLRRAADLIALSPEEGARTSIFLASSPEVDGISGRYFVKEKPAASSPQSQDGAAGRDSGRSARNWRARRGLRMTRTSRLGELEVHTGMCGIAVQAFLHFFGKDSHGRLFDDVVMVGGYMVNFNPSGDKSAPAEELIVAVDGSSRNRTKQSQGSRINLGPIIRASFIIHVSHRFPGAWQRPTERSERATRSLARSCP